MAIVCSDCQEEQWCLRFEGEWYCQDCFTQEHGTREEWFELNREAKEARQRKRERDAMEEEF